MQGAKETKECLNRKEREEIPTNNMKEKDQESNALRKKHFLELQLRL